LHQASKALSLLPQQEQQAVLKYYHVKDAKMSLASSLLKHLAIAKLYGVPWTEVVVSRDANGKPCYVPKTSGSETIEFNVSHQAGIVTIIACICAPGEVQLGTDVVCVNERDDYARIEKEGFFSWVDMHSDVFAPSETQALKMDTTQLVLPLPEGLELTGYARDAIARCQYLSQLTTWKDAAGQVRQLEPEVIIEAKLRRFFALWCLREAYVKMTGEALLAKWLQELEFRRFRTPSTFKDECGSSQISKNTSLELGEVVTDFEIFFKGKLVDDVAMELRAFEENYMVASAARLKVPERSMAIFGGFVELELERDIYTVAEAG
jgi:4'-phosphopantetheinyl transferase